MWRCLPGWLGLMLVSFPPSSVHAQACLGVPLAEGRSSFGGRFELGSPLDYYGAAVVHEGHSLGWEVHVGVVTNDFPQDLEPAIGGGLAWTGLHPSLCLAASMTASWPQSDTFVRETGDISESRQTGTVGVGIGRRVGEGAIGLAPYAYPHLFWTRRVLDTPDFDEVTTDLRFAIDLGAGLGGTNAWIGAGLRFIPPRADRGEDIPGTAFLLRGGVIF